MILEVLIGKHKYKLNCQSEEVDFINTCANSLNKRIKQLEESLKNSDDSQLLIMAALILEQKLIEKNNEFNEQSKALYTENDLYEIMSEHMDNISSYVEKIITKIDKL